MKWPVDASSTFVGKAAYFDREVIIVCPDQDTLVEVVGRYLKKGVRLELMVDAAVVHPSKLPDTDDGVDFEDEL